MPDSPQHRVDMNRLATNLKASGKPVWAGKVHVGGLLGNDDVTFEKTRDNFVKVIRASKWFRDTQAASTFADLVECVDEMEDTDTVDYFDQCLSALYDLADYDRIWLDGHAPARVPE